MLRPGRLRSLPAGRLRRHALSGRFAIRMAAELTSDAFVTAFARHGRALWVLASAWVGREDADDLVQETARIAWQRRETFAPGTDTAAWLAQIARHTGANWRRRRRPQPTDPHVLCDPIAPAFVAHHALHADDLPDDLARALASLPPTARACLLLHVVGGLTFPEIATMLELPENTAMSHARRARLALRDALAPPAARAGTAPLPELP
jgi:RNA polymerase sigma factor (sigma-70 family)